jgi:hypothetical protein
MESLKRLRVDLKHVYGESWDSKRMETWMERETLRPLDRIQHVEDFEVTLHWPKTDFVIGSVPYRLRRDVVVM